MRPTHRFCLFQMANKEEIEQRQRILEKICTPVITELDEKADLSPEGTPPSTPDGMSFSSPDGMPLSTPGGMPPSTPDGMSPSSPDGTPSNTLDEKPPRSPDVMPMGDPGETGPPVDHQSG